MKYEKDYQVCFDYLFFEGVGDEESLVHMLKVEYGVEITNDTEFATRVMDMLAKMHEDGIIRPASA
jgi:hypothetical protein